MMFMALKGPVHFEAQEFNYYKMECVITDQLSRDKYSHDGMKEAESKALLNLFSWGFCHPIAVDLFTYVTCNAVM